MATTCLRRDGDIVVQELTKLHRHVAEPLCGVWTCQLAEKRVGSSFVKMIRDGSRRELQQSARVWHVARGRDAVGVGGAGEAAQGGPRSSVELHSQVVADAVNPTEAIFQGTGVAGHFGADETAVEPIPASNALLPQMGQDLRKHVNVDECDHLVKNFAVTDLPPDPRHRGT